MGFFDSIASALAPRVKDEDLTAFDSVEWHPEHRQKHLNAANKSYKGKCPSEFAVFKNETAAVVQTFIKNEGVVGKPGTIYWTKEFRLEPGCSSEPLGLPYVPYQKDCLFEIEFVGGDQSALLHNKCAFNCGLTVGYRNTIIITPKGITVNGNSRGCWVDDGGKLVPFG